MGRQERCRYLILTGDLQGGVPAESCPLDVAGQAAVDPAVHLLFAVDGSEEEEAPVWQDNPVGGRICWSCLHQLAVFIPINYRLWVPGGLQRREQLSDIFFISTLNYFSKLGFKNFRSYQDHQTLPLFSIRG